MLALFSLILLAAIIFIANVTKKNAGLIGIAAAFFLGFFVVNGNGVPESSVAGGCKLILKAFPSSLFFRIALLSLFFNIAAANNTMKTVSAKLVAMVKGRRQLIPFLFYFLGFGITAVGVDGSGVQAVLLPIASMIAVQEGVPFLAIGALCTIGVWAGIQSPIARTGLICEGLANDLGYTLGKSNFIANICASVVCAIVIYIFLKGYKVTKGTSDGKTSEKLTFSRDQVFTLFSMAAFIVLAIMGFETSVIAAVMAVILMLVTEVDQKKVISMIPWSVLILLTGMAMYVSMMAQAGGVDLLVNGLSKLMNKTTLAPFMTLAGACMSFVSSASGVVMPTLYPTVPNLAAAVGGNTAFVMNAISVGTHATSISPISTGGGMVMAFGAGDFGEEEERKNFNRLIAVALIQTVVIFALSWTGVFGIGIPFGDGHM